MCGSRFLLRRLLKMGEADSLVGTFASTRPLSTLYNVQADSDSILQQGADTIKVPEAANRQVYQLPVSLGLVLHRLTEAQASGGTCSRENHLQRPLAHCPYCVTWTKAGYGADLQQLVLEVHSTGALPGSVRVSVSQHQA